VRAESATNGNEKADELKINDPAYVTLRRNSQD